MYCGLQMRGSGTVSGEPCVFALRAPPVISSVSLSTTVNSSRGYVLREFLIHYGFWGVETGCVRWSCLGKERITIHWFSSTKACTIICSPTPYLYEIDVRPYSYDTPRTDQLSEWNSIWETINENRSSLLSVSWKRPCCMEVCQHFCAHEHLHLCSLLAQGVRILAWVIRIPS